VRPPFSDDDVAIPTVTKERATSRMARGLRAHVMAGPDSGQTTVVAQPLAILGRSHAADVRLTDPMVSSFHVELSVAPEGIAVRDLESRNGTFYQSARVFSAVLPSGGALELGGSVLRLELDQPFELHAEQLPAFGELRGKSGVMRELFALLAKLARTELAVLIEGPTGVGKELAARAMHASSTHASGPFVVLDCTAIPGELAESVLFGHERGAFTGAVDRRAGIFESADDGTILLDEVGELPVELQPKLLRVLERREVVRLGSVEPRPVHARILSATWRDLRARINQGTFREDLYYRLTQARVVIPPLSARREDVPALIEHFLKRLPDTIPCARAIAPDALRELCLRDFPGNVRELKSTVERAAALAAGEVITPTDLAFERVLMGERHRITTMPPPSAAWLGDDELPRFKEAKLGLIQEFERSYLERLLQRTSGNLSRASALAGIERHHLRDLARKYGLREGK
jgi:DNA-binding NtrC family response regulator